MCYFNHKQMAIKSCKSLTKCILDTTLLHIIQNTLIQQNQLFVINI